jgi:hypothetical protein
LYNLKTLPSQQLVSSFFHLVFGIEIFSVGFGFKFFSFGLAAAGFELSGLVAAFTGAAVAGFSALEGFYSAAFCLFASGLALEDSSNNASLCSIVATS